MHKALAEALAALIPHKMTRNRWRGLLRYGIPGLLTMRRRLRRAPAPRYYLAVCAIAKDEGSYMAEWVDWHLSQGVDHLYIYDNDSSDDTRSVLRPYIAAGKVTYTPWPGYRRQIAAYDHCIEQHRSEARWMAFIDLDEYLVPHRHPTVAAFLREHEDAAAVEVNWLVYGSGGARERTPGTVMQRFRRHAPYDHPLNRHVKSIVDPRRVAVMTGCHEAARLTGYAVDSHGERITTHFRQRTPQHDVISVNHYAVKSLAEFRDKCSKGRASGTRRSIDMQYFDRYDLNDLEDKL